ncbi:unnamed protein product, partial [Heterotrigona itama]
FILADEGYDVWLGNVRGNRYSRRNLNLATSDADFWTFRYSQKSRQCILIRSYSWHEIGIYDIPAMIDHITEQTKQEKIFLVTHSQGGTAFFVMASERPEYQEKIIAHSVLAPVIFLSRAGASLAKLLALVTANGNRILNLLDIYEIKPSDVLVPTAGKVACPKESPLLPLCKGILDLLFGFDEKLNT